MTAPARTLLILLCATAIVACKTEAREGQAGGEILFQNNCAVCHGEDGGGKANIKAPAIAGLPQWYASAQLLKFREGARGTDPDDMEGMRMKPMAMTLRNDVEVDAVTTYIASLKPVPQETTLEGGNAEAGAAKYAVCTACHGPDGAGNEQLKAPPINQMSDWYLLSQLKKFKAGDRGTNPDDLTGQQMRPMAMTLTDEQAMKDVVAHIKTLGG